MGNIKGDEECTAKDIRPTTLIITDSRQLNADAGQTQRGDKWFDGIPIYLVRDKKTVPLNVPARNVIAHKSPNLLKHVVAEAFQRQANKEGRYQDKDCVIRWKPSAIPFHIEFEISVSGNTCQHLASVRSITAKDPDQYARNLASLAKVFLSKPPGTNLPHLPFTRPQVPSNNGSNRSAEDKQTILTAQHASLINHQYKSLTDMDIETAETTAKMVNTGKILPGLLVYLTLPKHGVEGTAMSKEAKKTECKDIQTSKGTSSTAKKKLKPPGPAHEHQGLEQVLNQKRVESHPKNDSNGLMVAGGSTPTGNSALEDISCVGANPSDGSAATTIGSPKEGKASKNQGRKQTLKERIKDKAICAVGAYPTQRPPRKKPARNAVTIKESRKKQRLGSAERDPEQVPTAQLPILEGSDHEDREANGPEQLVGLEESLQEDHGSEERDPEQVPAAQSLDLEELFQEERDPEQVLAAQSPILEGSNHNDRQANGPEQLMGREESLQEDHGSLDSSSECLDESLQDDHASPESSLGGHEESKFHTPQEALDGERIATEVGLVPSASFHGEDPITTTDEPVALSLPIRPRQEYGSGAKGLLWAYAISTEVDEALDDAGVFLWRKPNAHFQVQRLLRTEKFGCSDIAPVVVSHENTGDDEPIIEFDGDTVHIVPHEQCWEDVRSHESHPDFLVPWKLAEYQACEAAGYQVWRHDRDFLKCRKSACKATVSDYHRSVVVCLGCGPKSIVRYCSLRHQLDDIEEHWNECGTWNLLLRRVIDHTTTPSRFDRMYPAIKQRHGSKTAALHRQGLCFALTCGHYTLFDPASNDSKTLCWPKEDPKWIEMDRRIERLLNVAFLDSWNHTILGYLYRLLRELLRSRGEWSYSTESLLKLQLESEFSDYKVNPNWKNGDPPCECEWSGKLVSRLDHLSTCWAYTPVEDDGSPARSHRCIERIVEDYEERFWILRAWRHQHPMENNWRRRAAGYGFPNMVPDEGCYKLGPGWTGWGGENDNIREDRRDQRGRRIMRLV